MREYLYSIITDRRKGPAAFVVKGILAVVSVLYRAVLFLRAAAYRLGVRKPARLPRPVISVGNLTLGGSGKTPLVIYLARLMEKEGSRPAVLIRGYMLKKGAQPVQSDEAMLLSEVLSGVPVLTGKDRAGSARNFLKKGQTDCFLMDDGFQHFKLARDLDIVTVDATNPFGNGRVFPAGILREPLAALKRADVVVVTKTNLDSRPPDDLIRRIKGYTRETALIIGSRLAVLDVEDLRTGQRQSPETLSGLEAAAFCSIGSPEGFRATLEVRGVRVKKFFPYPDHYIYGAEDIKAIVRDIEAPGITALITTAKDAVKLKAHTSIIPDNITVLVVHVGIDLGDEEEKFLNRVKSVLDR